MPNIRKIEIDENGIIFHVYRIHDDYDPHNPNGGLEIDEKYSDLHEEMMHFLNDFRKAYIYDDIKGLRKKKLKECDDDFKPHLKEFNEIPAGFVKKNLGKTIRHKK